MLICLFYNDIQWKLFDTFYSNQKTKGTCLINSSKLCQNKGLYGWIKYTKKKEIVAKKFKDYMATRVRKVAYAVKVTW